MFNSTSIKLPNGEQLITRLVYTSKEQAGVTLLLIVSSLSLAAVVGLFIVLSLSAFHTRSYSNNEHLFVRTHVAVYFISLLLCDLIQAIGSLFNGRWIGHGAIMLDRICTAQGAFKHIADIGTAVWSFVIAIHTFCLLVHDIKPSQFTLFGILVAGWSGIFAVAVAGPAVLDTAKRGPFYGISGYWCWIADGYATTRITLDYLFMFTSAFLCFVLHTLINLNLRGYMTMDGLRIRFYRKPQERPMDSIFEDKEMVIAKQMLLFPITYCIIFMPKAIVRVISWGGHHVPLEAIFVCQGIFLLSGCVNVGLFCGCKEILPPESVVLMKRSISKPQPIIPIQRDNSVSTSVESDPYYSATVLGYSFSEKYKHEDQRASLERASTKLSVGSISGVSVSTERTLTPLEARRSRRNPGLPSLFVPRRRVNSTGGVDEFYEVPTGRDAEFRR